MTEKAEPRRAAAYVRMSSSDQANSIANQLTAIEAYADLNGFDVVRCYTDSGKSGLTIDGRDSLKRLIADVQTPGIDFSAILVLDVSRWGRFQDSDESAYYEYTCRKNGVEVRYVAEPFGHTGGPLDSVVKALKRVMAAEYSRELSGKVFAGQCRVVEQGFKIGGGAGYGLRRMMVSPEGTHQRMLYKGDRKSLVSDRVILVPGPDNEIAVVKWIFHAYVNESLPGNTIAQTLNKNGVKSSTGGCWTGNLIRNLLANEKYIGAAVYNRTSKRLSTRRTLRNHPDMWIRNENAFEAIIDPELFEAARKLRQERRLVKSDADMLKELKALWQRHGKLGVHLINAEPSVMHSSVYQKRFGTILEAYRRIGYDYSRDASAFTIRPVLAQYVSDLYDSLHSICEQKDVTLEVTGARSYKFPAGGHLGVSALRQKHHSGQVFWRVKAEPSWHMTLAVHLSETPAQSVNWYLYPAPGSLSWICACLLNGLAD